MSSQSNVGSSKSQFSMKPRLIKYLINRKQTGLGSRIVRQGVEVAQTLEDKPMETCKSLTISRPKTQQSEARPQTKKSRISQQTYTEHSEPQQQQQQLQIQELPLNQQYMFVDEIPLDHPIWNQILPNVAIFNIPKLIADNPDYFQHQLGFCACYKCECGNCRCNFARNIKFNHQSPQTTIYNRDFLHKSTSFNSLKPLYQDMYSTKFNDQKTIDLQSLQRSSYQSHKTFSQPQQRPQSQEHKGELIGGSSYKTYYKNWGPPDTVHFKRPAHVSVSDEIPFQAKSSYQNFFNRRGNFKPSESLKIMTELTPLPTGQPFISKSQSQLAYQPFKVIQMPELKSEFPKCIKDGPFYMNQYKTLSNLEFTPKNYKQCPAKDYLKQYQIHLQQQK